MKTHRAGRCSEWTIFGIVAVCLFIAAIATCSSGCTPAQVEQATQIRQQAEVTRVATTQAIADLEAQVATLPADDPVRKASESKLAIVRKKLADLDKYIPAVDAAILAASTGNFTDPALRDAVKDVPYASLVLTLGSFAYGLYQKSKKDNVTRALSQVVKGVEAVLPQKTDQQKLVLEAAQDASTKSLVAQAKG